MKQGYFILLLSLFSMGCSTEIKSAFAQTSSHKSNCINKEYKKPNGPLINGVATFKREHPTEIQIEGVSQDINDTEYPIRFAEVELLLMGTTIYCSQTDEFGKFSVNLPDANSTYTLKINSVSSKKNNSVGDIFILDSPENLQFYSIKRTFDSSIINNNEIRMIADINLPEVLGGAFNIYDRIIETNNFLKEMTKDCGDRCTPFTSLPPVHIYWTAGFNPGEYFGKVVGSSFYTDKKIFLLGGSNGDTLYSDIDHFDDVVIIHEYAHFIFDHFTSLFSPSLGVHLSEGITDPRFALVEASATFLAAAVLGDPRYIDTFGVLSNEKPFILEFENHPPTFDIPQYLGEGNFREFAITRSLWDMLDPYTTNGKVVNSTDDEEVNISFVDLWSILTKEIESTKHYFIDFALFLKLQSEQPNAKDISQILKREQLKNNREDYASNYTSCIKNKTISASELFPVYLQETNQFHSNDFYLYKHDGGNFTAELTYTADDPETDLDLIIYEQFYVYGDMDYAVGLSAEMPNVKTEQIDIRLLPYGVYMVNVVSLTPNSTAIYNLSLNGDLC